MEGNGVPVGPALVEVFNVRISKKMECYGIFSIEDNKGTVYLFNRMPKDTGSVKETDVLPLRGSTRVIPAVGIITFFIYLININGDELIKGSFTLDFTKENVDACFDKYLVDRIYGVEGLATIYYTIPSVARLSIVSILVNQDDDMASSEVNGSVVARYAKGYDDSADDDIQQNTWFTLFDNTEEDKPLLLGPCSSLPLWRGAQVIHPAWSSLEIKMDLVFNHRNGQSNKFTDNQIHLPGSNYPNYKWHEKLGGVTLGTRVHFGTQRWAIFDMDLEIDFYKAGEPASCGNALLEVFNVRIDEKKEVYGTFSIEDYEGTVYLFKRMLKDAGSVEATDVLPLSQQPRVIRAISKIDLSLNLTDKNGDELINESFNLDFTEENTFSTFDKYRVAPINGKNGKAKVYYTIPIVALETDFGISIIQNVDSVDYSDVNGRIVARYDKTYDDGVDDDVEENTWFTLFETSRGKPFQVKDKDLLPLSRIGFIIPARSALVIRMDLELLHSNGRSDKLSDYEFKLLKIGYDAPVKEVMLSCVTLKAVLHA